MLQHEYLFFVVASGVEGLAVCATETFDAPHDIEAIEIATSVFSACDDAFYSYGLWLGNRMVVSTDRKQRRLYRPNVIAIQQQRDQQVLALLERLRDDYPALVRSAKLSDEIEDRRRRA
jgi:hypothetical protein